MYPNKQSMLVITSEDWRFMDSVSRSVTGSLVLPRYLRILDEKCASGIYQKVKHAARHKRVHPVQYIYEDITLPSHEALLEKLAKYRLISPEATKKVEEIGIPYREGVTHVLMIDHPPSFGTGPITLSTLTIGMSYQKYLTMATGYQNFHVSFYWIKFELRIPS